MHMVCMVSMALLSGLVKHIVPCSVLVLNSKSQISCLWALLWAMLIVDVSKVHLEFA